MGEVRGLLISDYYSDRLYDEGLALSFPHGLAVNFSQLQNSDSLLQAPHLTQSFEERPEQGFKYKFLREITVTNNLVDEQTVIYDLTFIVSVNPRPLIVRNLMSFIILAIIAVTLFFN